MKALLWFGLLMVGSLEVRAENFYSPLLCPVEEVYLHVQNTSPEPQSFWLQALGANPFSETHLEVKPLGTLHLPLEDLKSFGNNNETALALKTQNGALQFKAHCKKSSLSWSLEKTTSPWKKLSIPAGVGELRLHLVNLSQQTNSVEISFESLWGKLESHKLLLSENFEDHLLNLKVPPGASRLLIQAQGRWSGKILTPKEQELPLMEEVLVLNQAPVTRYFLFESRYPETQESFVVPMQNPRLIQESLDQIAAPEKARLLVARIDKSLSGLNRDFSSAVKTPWSWQVIEAQNYADFAHISCDGTPGLVEERLTSWLPQTGGTICFWNYRVVRELTLKELKQ